MILKRSLLKFIKTGAVPLLLTTVVLRQIILVHTAALSPWHGGGFGMFASIDRDERRLVTTTVLGCQGQSWHGPLANITADFPQVLSPDRYTHVSTLPTQPLLHDIGMGVLSTDAQHPIAEFYGAAGEEDCDAKVQLQVWRLVYDGHAIAYEPITRLVEVQP